MKKLILFLTLLAIPLHAEVKKDIFIWDDFSGGLNTKLSSFSLPKSQGITCENVRFGKELKALTKREQILSYGSADTTETITGMHRLYLKDGTKVLIVTHGDEIEVGSDSAGTFSAILDLGSGNYKWQWETWHDLAIGTDGYNQPVKTDGTDATYLGSCFCEDAGSGAGPDGDYTYKISYYTTSYEVLFNVVSNPVTVVDNDISLSMIPIAPDSYGGEDVTGRKIYRISDGGSDYKLLSNGTIANNTATTLTDSDADGARGAAYPAGDSTYTPPKGRLILIHNNRLFIANDPSYPSRIYYSEDGSHDVFKTGAYFDIRPNDGDEITFIKNILGILTISKNNTVQKLYTDGDTPSSDWEISDPFSHVGCQAMYSASNSPLGVIYLSSDGLYSFNGQNEKKISDAVSPEIRDISETDYANCWGIYHEGIYYMAYTSEQTGSSTNDRVLLLDILTNAYSTDILSLSSFCAFDSGTDWGVLYSGSSTDGNVYSHSETVHGLIHKRHSDFTGTFDDMRYRPTAYGGDANSPILELSWDLTINGASGTINSHSYGSTAIIDRMDTGGTYISQALEIGSSTLDKIYWNERVPSAGGSVLAYVRTGATAAACGSASWSSSYTNPTGSDISAVTANDFLQYKLAISTDDIDFSPTIYKANNYVVRVTYDVEGSSNESTIPLHWESGWNDLGYPGHKKTLMKLYVYYDYPADTSGTLNLTFENLEGNTDVFEIDLLSHPDYYVDRFTTGKFLGEFFKLDIAESSLNDITIKKIFAVFEVEPLV